MRNERLDAARRVPLVRNERLVARMSEFARHAHLSYAQGGSAWSGDYAGSGCGGKT